MYLTSLISKVPPSNLGGGCSAACVLDLASATGHRAPSTDLMSHYNYRSPDGNAPQQTLKGSFSLYKAIQTWRIPLLPETHLAFARIKSLKNENIWVSFF